MARTDFPSLRCLVWAEYNLVVDLIFIIGNYQAILNTNLIELHR